MNAFNTCYNSLSFLEDASSTSASDIDKKLEQLEKEADEIASNSFKITEGPLFDTITNIYSDISITDMNNAISFSINIPHSSYEDDALAFIYISSKICNSYPLEHIYDSIAFTYNVDDEIIATLFLTNYTSPTSFSSTPPVVFEDSYENAIEKYYYDFFLKMIYLKILIQT